MFSLDLERDLDLAPILPPIPTPYPFHHLILTPACRSVRCPFPRRSFERLLHAFSSLPGNCYNRVNR
jgi:hypothetical protein